MINFFFKLKGEIEKLCGPWESVLYLWACFLNTVIWLLQQNVYCALGPYNNMLIASFPNFTKFDADWSNPKRKLLAFQSKITLYMSVQIVLLVNLRPIDWWDGWFRLVPAHPILKMERQLFHLIFKSSIIKATPSIYLLLLQYGK